MPVDVKICLSRKDLPNEKTGGSVSFQSTNVQLVAKRQRRRNEVYGDARLW